MHQDCLKNISALERNFSLLKINGVFDKICGLILGKHELFDDGGTSRKPYDVLLEVIEKPEFPILAEYDCCHTHPMLTLPMGCEIELDSTNEKVTLLTPG